MKPDSLKFVAIVLFMIGWGLLFLSSCATLGIGTGPLTPMLFQSDEYILCRVKEGEAPGTLAERFLGDKKRSWVIEDANEGIAFNKGELVVIPLKEENKGGLTPDGFQVVPILSYHQFADHCSFPLCMPTRIFDRQMNYLKEKRYTVVSLRDVFGFLHYHHALPKRSVVLTIDDGYRSIYDIAYPILKKYGFTATLFIYTDFVGACRNAVTWNQLSEMKADGFEVGGHTMSHCDLTKQKEGEDLQAYMARIERELRVSKQIIDKKLGQDTISLAFPYGSYDQRVLSLCKRQGYKIAVSVKRGSNPFFANPFALKRSQVLKRDMRTFVSRLKTFHKLSLK